MDLRDKFNLYHTLFPSKQDASGFILSDECDSLLFTGLVGSVPGINVDIDAAQDAQGSWHRRPLELPECCPEFSKSSISRDMLLGLAWYAYSNGRLDISEGVIKYALSHWMVMGKGAKSRTIMTPGLLSTFAWISYRLGGPSRLWLRWIPTVESAQATDYQAHLSMLHILLRRELTGKEDLHADVAQAQCKRQPNNPLFQWAAGNGAIAESILMDERLWPNDRLPTSRDRKGEWLLQRDDGHNWQPGEGDHIHTGGDFLFLANLVLNH